MLYLRQSSVWVASSLLALSQTVLASGFMLHEQNASGLGEFYAGSAAIAEEASTNYYNPAGMVLLKDTNIAISGVWVDTTFNFEGDVAYQTLTTQPYTASGAADGGTDRVIPAIHITHTFNDNIAAGISFTVPFGLATRYDNESIVRYQALLSDLKTYNIGPSIAYRVVPWLALGVGFDAQYATVDITSATNYHVFDVPNPDTDAKSDNSANSWGWGWHAGALAIVDPKTRIGLNFRSNINHEFEGDSKYTDPTYGETKSDVSGDIDFPWMIDLSGVYEFDDQWTVLGSVSYIHWSSIEALKLENVSLIFPFVTPAQPPIITPTPVTGTSVDELNFKGSWGAFAGLRYQWTHGFMVKFGGGFDQSPTNSHDRDLRLPDSNRWIAAVGARVVPPQADRFMIDVAYAHLWAVEGKIEKDLASTTNPINTADGHVDANANLIGLQFSVRI